MRLHAPPSSPAILKFALTNDESPLSGSFSIAGFDLFNFRGDFAGLLEPRLQARNSRSRQKAPFYLGAMMVVFER